jgi:hypothetical protein
MSNYWLTRPYVKLPLFAGIGSVGLGDGVDASDPDNPHFTNVVPFDLPASDRTPPPRTAVPTSGIVNHASIIDASTEYAEALAISAYFRGSFGIASFGAALSFAQQRRQVERSVYIVIESEGDDRTLHVPALKWKTTPTTERADLSDADRRSQFVQTYGSHYVSSLRYGSRIALRGALQTLDASQALNFSAAFSGWGVSAGADVVAKNQVEQFNVTISAEVTCGSITPPQSYVITTFAAIQKFLDGLHDNTIQITRAPIQAELASFKSTLLDYPKSRSVFTPTASGDASKTLPRGTILAWYPTSDNIIEVPGPSGAPIRAVQPPDGWAICDGRPNTVSLVDKFLLGAGNLDAVGRRNESSTHSHAGSTLAADRHRGESYGVGDHPVPACTGLDHYHGLAVAEAAHWPPYVSVLYIIKL